MEETIEVTEQDRKNIKKYFDEAITKYASIWGSENVENLKSVEVKLEAKLFENKQMIGLTKSLKQGWYTWPEVIFDPIVLGLVSKKAIMSVVTHEMAHCCVFFDNMTLEEDIKGGHGPHWQAYADKLNKTGLNVQAVGDEEYNVYLFGK